MLFTYRAQITFGLSSPKEVNIANFFLGWLSQSKKDLPKFSLLPHNSDFRTAAEVILDEVAPNDIAFFRTSYGNQRVLQHGNLTGMVQFQTSVSWSMLKGFKNPYFTWLKAHRVFLNYTKFKTDTLVACGFSVGAHPGFMRRDKAEEEICGSLGFDKDEANFQLSSRYISVPIKDGE